MTVVSRVSRVGQAQSSGACALGRWPCAGGPAAAGPSQPAQATLVYIGTYTGTKSKGIYVSRLDLAQGTLSAPVLAAESSNPSFLAVHPTRDLLYAVNEIGTYEGKPSGSVSAFTINRETGALTRVEPAAVGRRRPRAPHRGPRRPERARRELRRRERRGAADRRRRRAQAGVGLRPAHRLERQPRTAEGTARAFGQRRRERSLRVCRGPRPRQSDDLPARRGQGIARGQRPAVRGDAARRRPAALRASIRAAALPM